MQFWLCVVCTMGWRKVHRSGNKEETHLSEACRERFQYSKKTKVELSWEGVEKAACELCNQLVYFAIVHEPYFTRMCQIWSGVCKVV